MKNLFKILRIASIITLIITVFNIMAFETSEITAVLIGEHVLWSFVFSFVLTAVNAFYYDGISLKYNWEKDAPKRLWIGALGSLILTMVTFGLLRLVMAIVMQGYTVNQFLQKETTGPYIIAGLIALIVSLALHAFYFYKALQEKKVKEQQIIAGTATAQFDALKNQLDPHFLFNSLNVLSSLIDENPENAQDFTTSLSKVYRYVLEQKNKELVSIAEELNFAKTYVGLLKMRFENSIHFEMPATIINQEAKVVPLSLQLLLENAVKHNTVNESNPLTISIYEEHGFLVVKNKLQTKQVVHKGAGVGLQNIKQRYGLLTQRKVVISKTEEEFTVKLPILTKQSSINLNTTDMDTDLKYVRARKRVEDLKEFYMNIISYCLVIPFLIFINYKTFWGFQWFWFPMFGWGIGIVIHAYKVYYTDGFLGRNWEERKLQEFMKEEGESNLWE